MVFCASASTSDCHNSGGQLAKKKGETRTSTYHVKYGPWQAMRMFSASRFLQRVKKSELYIMPSPKKKSGHSLLILKYNSFDFRE